MREVIVYESMRGRAGREQCRWAHTGLGLRQ
jgi:hypothetical protein